MHHPVEVLTPVSPRSLMCCRHSLIVRSRAEHRSPSRLRLLTLLAALESLPALSSPAPSGYISRELMGVGALLLGIAPT